MKTLAIILSVVLLGCGALREPKYAEPDPIYPLPTISLQKKAELLEQRILDEHLNEEGYLLYAVDLPLSENYAASHNSADLPSWHGHWLMALAFKQAVDASEENLKLIHRGIEGLRANFDATGKRGLLARSYLKYDGILPLPWMEKYNEEDYPTKHWRKGENGYWFRTGVAKGHYESAMLGLGALVGLDTSGNISLPPETRELLHITVEDIALYLMGGGYNIRDFDGERTEFGKLSDWKYNGQSAVQVIGMLSVCSATGNMICAEEYDRIVAHWTTPLSMGLYGGVWKTLFSTLLGPHNGFYKPNDTIHATCAILMHHLTSERKALQQDRNRKLLVKLSAMSGRDRNPFFNYVLELMERQDPQNLVDALLTLRMFPDDKRQISALTEEDTKEIQPISNLRINSHYWKTRWYERRERTEGSARTNVEYSGQDYLGVYWMGRFYGFISDEEANQPISW